MRHLLISSAAALATLATAASAQTTVPTTGPIRWGDQGDGTYRNPILPGDFSDPDVIRVGADYYLITSSFQYAPGMAILHSRDLVNWRYLGHCIPDVGAIGPELRSDRMNRAGKGVWAGALRYHDGRFWMFTTTMDEGIFMTTAADPAGPWSPVHRVSDRKNVDDVCPFWDDDGRAWLLFSTPGKQGWFTRLAPMSPDGRSVDFAAERVVDDYQSSEGNKLYKFGDTYYVFHNENRGGSRIGVFLRSQSLAGPWEKRAFLQSRAKDRDREPNQGGLVDTPDGKRWYFLTHHGRGGFYEGRVVSLVPVAWTADGWPQVEPADASGAGTVAWTPIRKPLDGQPPAAPQSDDDFDATTLAPQWEWNYEPPAGTGSLTARPGFLRLAASRPIKPGDLTKTPGALTQRVMGRNGGTVTAKLDVGGLADGGQAGLCLYADTWATVGVARRDGARALAFTDSTGTTAAGPALAGDDVWLRFDVDADGTARAAYSLDGTTFAPIGTPYALRWAHYRGTRIGLFSSNDRADAGHVDVDSFRYAYPGPGATTRPN